jgi:glycine amidinotransferase
MAEVVNSWNEWDPLTHIILGRANSTMVQAPEPAVQHDWSENGFALGRYGRLPERMEEKAKEQLDNFAEILEGEGIRVDRPTPLDFSQRVQTPDWVQETMFGCMPARDLLLTVGNEIVEATMSYRSRWFEYLCYRPLLERYFNEDRNMRWVAAPKPRLTERSYKKDYWSSFNAMSHEQRLERAKTRDWVLTESEPLFDAADVGRFGKDLFVQASTATNAAGIDWLRRHFPNHRIHTVHFLEESPIHIDATFVPLRPGLALINPDRPPLVPALRELFKKNDWEIVESAKPSHDGNAPLSFCSQWLSMNVVVLDSETVCVEASETAQMKQLEEFGFDVISVPFWNASPFGGGLHCSTADVHREGTCKDYFPEQVEGF